MSEPLRYATEADGPLTVELTSGARLKVAYLDGGGMGVGDTMYEVHGSYMDGGFLCILQDQIKAVFAANGDEIEFGNPYMPGHPRPLELGFDSTNGDEGGR